jgi:hypothetical protein
MIDPDASGFVPGATVEFTKPDDPGHHQGERGQIAFEDPNGDFHILWERAGAEVWSMAEMVSELRLVPPPKFE